MTTEFSGLAQCHEEYQAAVVSTEGHRPEGETTAEPRKSTPDSNAIPDVQVKSGGQSAPKRKFSTAYKLKILEQYENCNNALARGALLRKEGLYSSRISTWKKQRDNGKLAIHAKNNNSAATTRNQKLQRENEMLKRKLAQAEAVIDLQKKVSELLGTHILPAKYSENS